MSDAYRRTRYQGHTLNYRTLEMLERARRQFGFTVTISQGSYNVGVSQSAGTHDGGGVLDVGGSALTSSQRKTVETELRRVGFAAWVRDPSQGDWPYHIHAVAVADAELSSAAANQVTAYNNGRNGLAGNGPDTGTRQFVGTVYPQELDVSFYGPENWDDADWEQFHDKGGWGYNIKDEVAADGSVRDAKKMLAYVHKNGSQTEDLAKEAKAEAINAGNQAAAAQTTAGEALQAVQELDQKLFPPA